MINRINILFTYLFLLVPLFLITGPAIPDIIITFGGIFGILWIVFKNRDYNLIKNNFVIVSIVFWLGLIFTSFFSLDFEKSIQDSSIFVRYLLIPICCYFLFFYSKSLFNRLLLLILILSTFVCIDTLFQFFNYSTQHGFGKDILGFKSDWYGRLTGPFGKELIPGSYVSKFGLVGFAYLLINKNIKYNLFYRISYLTLILVVCFVSGERMAFATYLMGLFLLLFFLDKERISLILSIFIGLLSIIIILKFHPFYNDYKTLESTEYHQGLKVEKSFKCENDDKKICSKIVNLQPSFYEVLQNFPTSAYGEIYILGFQMFKDNPITGIGLSNYKYLCEQNIKYKKMMVNYDCASHPHNIYVQWLAEGGLIIFLLFILYLFSLCNLIIKNEGSKNLKIISIVILLILFWPIMSTGSLIKNWYGVINFFIIAVTMCMSRIKINS